MFLNKWIQCSFWLRQIFWNTNFLWTVSALGLYSKSAMPIGSGDVACSKNKLYGCWINFVNLLRSTDWVHPESQTHRLPKTDHPYTRVPACPTRRGKWSRVTIYNSDTYRYWTQTPRRRRNFVCFYSVQKPITIIILEHFWSYFAPKWCLRSFIVL